MTNEELVKGKYKMVFGREGKTIDVYYRGRRNDNLVKLFPHEFITRYPPGSRDRQDNSVLSLRIRERGFKILDKTIVPIPNENGQFFYSNIYFGNFGDFHNLQVGRIKKLDGEAMLRDLEEEGL